MRVQREGSHLCAGDDAAGRVPSRVQLRFDAQPRRGSRVANERDYRLECLERTTTPILGDVTEETMLDLVPFAGAGRKVRHVDGQLKIISRRCSPAFQARDR